MSPAGQATATCRGFGAFQSPATGGSPFRFEGDDVYDIDLMNCHDVEERGMAMQKSTAPWLQHQEELPETARLERHRGSGGVGCGPAHSFTSAEGPRGDLARNGYPP